MARNISSNETQRAAFGLALEAAARSAGIKSTRDLWRAGLAAGITRGEDTYGMWMRGVNEPSRADVLILESVCKLSPGTLSRCFGWVPVGVDPSITVEAAIASDPDLSPERKRILLELLVTLRNS